MCLFLGYHRGMHPSKGSWWPVLASSELGKQPVGRTRFGERFVFWRDGGRVVCMADQCPHRGAALSLGCVDAAAGTISCPFHGLAFAADGRCVKIPMEQDYAIPEGFGVRTLPAHEEDGYVWVWYGPLPDGELPAVPRHPDTLDMRYGEATGTWHAHYTRCIENVCDFSHLPFVHKTTIGRFKKDWVISVEVEDVPGRFPCPVVRAGQALAEHRVPVPEPLVAAPCAGDHAGAGIRTGRLPSTPLYTAARGTSCRCRASAGSWMPITRVSHLSFSAMTGPSWRARPPAMCWTADRGEAVPHRRTRNRLPQAPPPELGIGQLSSSTRAHRLKFNRSAMAGAMACARWPMRWQMPKTTVTRTLECCLAADRRPAFGLRIGLAAGSPAVSSNTYCIITSALHTKRGSRLPRLIQATGAPCREPCGV